MKIGILSLKPNCYSTKRLVEAGLKLGHDMHVINTLRCYMNVTAEKNPSVHYNGKILADFDAIIPRIASSQSSSSPSTYGISVVRQFETSGVFSINDSVAIARARDKLRALQLLAKKGIDMPTTGFAHSPDDIDDLLSMISKKPQTVIKLVEGNQGVGVVLAETKKAAKSVIEAFMRVKASILVQEYIQEAQGCDLRCFVVGNKVVAAMKRQAEPGEFRSNIHRGGVACSVKITPSERKIAVSAAKVMGLNVAGVDIIRSERGPLVLEVNSSPGLQGIETSTGKDVAAMIIQFIEDNALNKKDILRNRG